MMAFVRSSRQFQVLCPIEQPQSTVSGKTNQDGLENRRLGCRAQRKGRDASPTKSKHPAKLEKPFAMSAIADASSEYQRSHRGLGQNAEGDIIGKLAGAGEAIHLAELVTSDGIDFLSRQRWQGPQIVQISGPEEIELVAEKFVGAISAEPVRAAKEKLRESAGGVTESSSAFADQE